jgi:hypothetical protein
MIQLSSAVSTKSSCVFEEDSQVEASTSALFIQEDLFEVALGIAKEAIPIKAASPAKSEA